MKCKCNSCEDETWFDDLYSFYDKQYCRQCYKNMLHETLTEMDKQDAITEACRAGWALAHKPSRKVDVEVLVMGADYGKKNP